jgi:hypothetical protein
MSTCYHQYHCILDVILWEFYSPNLVLELYLTIHEIKRILIILGVYSTFSWYMLWSFCPHLPKTISSWGNDLFCWFEEQMRIPVSLHLPYCYPDVTLSVRIEWMLTESQAVPRHYHIALSLTTQASFFLQLHVLHSIGHSYSLIMYLSAEKKEWCN